MIYCCATFVSSLWHASVRADGCVMKIVLFMKYRDQTFKKGNKNNQTYRNIFVEEERNSNVDSDDDLPLSTWKSNKKKSTHTIIILRQN